LIDEFYLMLGIVNVLRVVDFRGLLQNDVEDHEYWWADELHPTKKGFNRVGIALDRKLRGLD
jgi:hypothetical protein